jgi:hypothetical protein
MFGIEWTVMGWSILVGGPALFAFYLATCGFRAARESQRLNQERINRRLEK